MHYPSAHGANAYRAIGIETGVAAADPLGLVVMLYDGAIQAIVRAESHLTQGDIEGRGTYTSRAIDIINQGLLASLDVRVGGALTDSLWSLYEYMSRRLLAANMGGDRAIYVEVRGLLCELRDAWVELRKSQAPGAAARLDASRGLPSQASGRSIAA
jgi:flagellar secretion chaperone FliS